MSNEEVPAGSWRDVLHDYRRLIENGFLEPGRNLPTISELAKSTCLSEHGARRVLEKLREEGRVQSWHGKGFRVAAPQITFKMNAVSPAFGDQVRALGLSPSSDVIAGRLQRLPPDFARRLKRRSNAPVLRAETLRRVNGRVVALSTDYFLPEGLHDMLDTLKELGSVSKSLARHGIESYQRDGTKIKARLPTAHEALILGIPKGQPIYATFGLNKDSSGEVFQLSQGALRADCVDYQI